MLRRSRSYNIAEKLNHRLEEMGTTLEDLIDRVNKSQMSDDQDNPVRACAHGARSRRD